MALVNVYLNFNGNCKEAFDFYKSVLGGDFGRVHKFSEMPANPAYPLADADKEKIMHISFPISKETTLMGADTTANSIHQRGNDFQLSITPDSKEEADKIFSGLSEGGEITMPLQDTFWGAYFGMLKDKFGVSWMVNYEYPAQ